MKIAFDMSSIMWTGLQVGKDVEGTEVEHNGRKVLVNSAAYGYENCVNMMVKAVREYNLVPKDVIMVFEGMDSKKRRCMIDPTYKGNREGGRPPEAYIQFNVLKDQLCQVWRDVGAIAVSQPFVEGDDVLGWLAEHTEEELVIVTNDNDMAVLNGINPQGVLIQTRINGEKPFNKYGDFDFKLITLYKALVGDSSDNIKGCPGFGPKAFLTLNATYDDDGCFELLELIAQGRKDDLATIAKDNSCKLLNKIVDQWESVYKSYRLALLHPEWVNTVKSQLQWLPGMVKPTVTDERLTEWKAQARLVTASNYSQAVDFFVRKLQSSEFVALDFETTTPEESDEWLEMRDKKDGVDVIASRVVSCCLTFGQNNQYSFYLTAGHRDSDNITLEQMADMLALIPQDKHIVAHNAAGFELPVAYNAWGERWKDNGWRGFIPNMVDTRIAATFWDENQPTFGLKTLTKLLFGYEQDSFAKTTTKEGEVGTLPAGGRLLRSTNEMVNSDGSVTPATETRQYKMHELTAAEVLGYGVDDGFTAASLWNFFKLFMQLEHTYQPFMQLEQKPMYLSALAYVQGVDVDIPRLKTLEKADRELSDKCWKTLETYLIEKGWDGVVCPVYTELTPAAIKEIVQIVTGQELKTMVRTISKLAILVRELDEGLGTLIERNDVENINKLVALHFEGKPNFNVGSPKQISHLLYNVIGMPVRLRNPATAVMRAAGQREGTPRTDDGAINMAIKFKDVGEREVEVLQAILEMKSCNTRNSLYWSALPAMVHWKTNKLHPSLQQSATNTRRWTCSAPNIQQLEGNSQGVRSVIKAEKDYVFVSLDFASQEVRQVASYSEDPALMSCYIGANKRDTHSIVGARVAGVTYDEFMAMRKSEDKEVAARAAAIRQIAKVVLFATLYSAAAPKIAETLGITEEDAQTYIDAIFGEFPKVKDWKLRSEDMAESLGYVTIAGGTRRHLAKLITSDDKWEASKALRQAGNARIQGAGANQVKTVMSAVWDSDLLDTTSLRWKFVVHDEVCFSVHKSDATQIIERVHSIMTQDFLGNIPSESSIGIGLNYGQLTELEKALAALGVGFDAETVQKTVDSVLA